MYERYTDRARKVMQIAVQTAQDLVLTEITPECLLLGLLKEGCGVGMCVLKNLDCDVPAIQQEVMLAIMGVERPTSKAVSKLESNDDTKNILRCAINQVTVLGHKYVGTEHLLLGILEYGKSAGGEIISKDELDGARILREQGITYERAREELANLLGETLTS